MTSEEKEVGYLTPGDVAALLQVSIKSVYRWAGHDPAMPTLRIGGCIRFPRERFLAWLKGSEQGRGRARQSLAHAYRVGMEYPAAMTWKEEINRYRAQVIVHHLAVTRSNVNACARALGMTSSNLRKSMRHLRIGRYLA